MVELESNNEQLRDPRGIFTDQRGRQLHFGVNESGKMVWAVFVKEDGLLVQRGEAGVFVIPPKDAVQRIGDYARRMGFIENFLEEIS